MDTQLREEGEERLLGSRYPGKTLIYKAVMNISANQTEMTRRSHDFLHWLWALGNFPE